MLSNVCEVREAGGEGRSHLFVSFTKYASKFQIEFFERQTVEKMWERGMGACVC